MCEHRHVYIHVCMYIINARICMYIHVHTCMENVYVFYVCIYRVNNKANGAKCY